MTFEQALIGGLGFFLLAILIGVYIALSNRGNDGR